MKEGLSLLVDLYELTMAECYFRQKPEVSATFELFVRQLPSNRNYLIAAGLEDLLDFIRELKFSLADLKYLSSLKLFSRDFLKFLGKLRFSGDIWAMPEGTVFFPNEPIVRVTAPIIEAQLLESFFLNAVNLQTMLASKAGRVVLSAQGRAVHDFSLRRTHGIDAGMKAARSSYIAGFSGTSNVRAGKLYSIPLSGTMAHSFVMSFENELESFRAYSKVFPERTILLVDTYDARIGLENAVRTGLELKGAGHHLAGIRLDSGDIAALSKLARQMLDKAGLRSVKIFATGDLDEFKIEEIISKGGRVDSFGVGTHMGTSSDAPSLEVIYKLCEISRGKGEFLPTMKLSANKITYPGRKQVFRVKNRSNKFVKDILALEAEKVTGLPLLKQVVSRGQRVCRSEALEDIRSRAKSELAGLPDSWKINVSAKKAYPVAISPKLAELTVKVSRRLTARQ
jgi:nicotinate phosphoribosyltransferase